MLPRRTAFLAAKALSQYSTLGSTSPATTTVTASFDLITASAFIAGTAFVFSNTDHLSRFRSVSTLADTAFKYNNALPEVVLYQYEVCPFCCKVRTFLDYHKIPYKVVEVNPISKTELKWSNYKKVPVIKLGDEQINDSDVIISTLSEKLKGTESHGWFSNHSAVASDGSDDERKWREWVNTKFVRIITANIYRSVPESWETFDYIVKNGNFGAVSRTVTRMFGTASMYIIGKRMPSKYNIKGDLREALYSATEEWIQAVGSKDYLGGKKPNLADLAVYGVIEAIKDTSAYNDLMKNTNVGNWHNRMSALIGESSRLTV